MADGSGQLGRELAAFTTEQEQADRTAKPFEPPSNSDHRRKKI